MNKNLDIFSRRFPSVYAALVNKYGTAEKICCTPELSALVVPAKSGAPTLRVNGVFIHSAYDPDKEADRIVSGEAFRNSDTLVFAGLGLGYMPAAAARLYAGKYIAVVEPDTDMFLLAMETADLSVLLRHERLAFFLDAPEQTVISFLNGQGIGSCHIHSIPFPEGPESAYLASLETLIQRNRQKDDINTHTLEKFGRLWLKNMVRNLDSMYSCGGIKQYEQKAAETGIPACVLAAGPSLDRILPFLKEIKKRFLLICVDTALRACLSAGVQPDIIVLVDPQYWNARHIEGLSSPQSILVTESATWPSVFRFPCRQIVLCASLFPLGKLLEKKAGIVRGELGAGGSVATTAWDFARAAGCPVICMAGLDLAFPGKKTHFKGSTFENRAHLLSGRLHPAETDNCAALYSASSYTGYDYTGAPVLTDRRMALYAWWFESKCAAFPQNRTKTLSPEGLRIPGVETADIQTVLSYPERREDIEAFLGEKTRSLPPEAGKKERFVRAVREITEELEITEKNAKKAERLCAEASRLSRPAAYPHGTEKRLRSIHAELDSLDTRIRSGGTAELVSLIFPGQKTLREQMKRETGYDGKEQSAEAVFTEARFIYGQIAAAAAEHADALKKYLDGR